MAQKDPAVLFYIGKWLTSTAEMESDVRGWYLNLILHQYDKGSLPCNIETLATLCNVKFSEFERFKQVFEQVLKQKFKQNEDGRLQNDVANEILKARQIFKEKRERSGNIGVVIKMAKAINGYDKDSLDWLKSELFTYTDEEIELSKDKQVLEQMLKLYINININKNKDLNKDEIKDLKKDKESAEILKKEKTFKIPELSEIEEYFIFKESSKFEAEKFFNFYEAKNWKIGKEKMSKWKAAASGWILRNKTDNPGLTKFSGKPDLKSLDRTEQNKATTLGALEIIKQKRQNNEI
jgi:hypothetical protein